jgi:DNA-binding NarL/FixJ family response regulator
MGTNASALIIAGPGPLRDGLRALLGTMPQIRSVSVVNDLGSALKAEVPPTPALVLLDGGSTKDQVWLAVRRVKGRWPQARVIILVSDVEQEGEAEAAGADAVLLQGLPAGRLVAAVVRVLPQPVL